MPARPPSAALLATGSVLLLASATGHISGGFFIAFRNSPNFATGHDPVYQPGERMHCFTSPLGSSRPVRLRLGTARRWSSVRSGGSVCSTPRPTALP